MSDPSESVSRSASRSGLPVPRAAVFFDAVHTLFDLEPDYAGAFARVAHDFGYPVELRRVQAALAPLLEALDERKRRPISHRCSPESLWQEWVEFNKAVFRAVGIDGDAEALSLEMERRFDSGLYAKVYPEALAVLARMRELGLATGIVSNGTAGLENCLRVLGLSQSVDVVLISALVGYEKPAVEIFRCAEKAVRVPGSRCLMVGDNYWADIAGALGAGWSALWYNPRGKPAPTPCFEVRLLGDVSVRVEDWIRGLSLAG